MNLRLTTALLLLLAAPLARGGDRYNVRAFGVGAGLPNANVTVAYRSRDGYLWVGTEGGLARFNGVRFTTFRDAGVPAIAGGLIQSLAETPDGDLWIGTQQGLVRRHQGRFEAAGLPGISITALAVDHDGALWVGTLWQGLYDVPAPGAKPVLAPQQDALPSPRIRCLSVDSLGRIWVGCARGNGVAVVEKGVIGRFAAPRNIRTEITGVCEEPLGTLWFSTLHHGIFRLQGGQWTSANLGGRVLSLVPDGEGGLWAATNQLWHADAADALHFQAVGHTIVPNLGYLLVDREHSIWVCAGTEGLVQVRRSSYDLLPEDDTLAEDGIKSVCEDPAGALWMASFRHGVLCRMPDGFVRRFIPPGVQADSISGVLAARDGSVWVGAGAQLWKLRGDQMRLIGAIAGIHGMYQDRAGVLWIGSVAGVQRGGPGDSFTLVKLPWDRKDEPPLATCFGEDGSGALYIGTWRDGIYRLAAGQITRMNHATGLPNDEVRSLHVGGEGLVWAGLRTGGLAVWIGGQWRHSTALAEAIGNHVEAIEEDDLGRIWLGTTLGILWAPKAEVLAALLGQGPTPKMRFVGLSDGPESPSIWLGSKPVSWRLRGGKLAFATHRGALVIDPASVGGNAEPPPVRVTRVIVDDRAEEAAPEMSVPPGARRIAFEYDAMSLVQSDRIRFEYRLDGFSPDWVDAGSQRSIVFSRLPPQTYVFRVRAASSDGEWDPAGTAVTLRVNPFFWQRWWFRIAAIAAFTAAVAALVRYVSFRRLRRRVLALEQEAALNRERARIAKDIHDDLGGSLTQLKLVLELVQRERDAPEKVGGLVRQGLRAARAAIKSLDQTVWAVNPRNDTLPHLIDYMAQYALEFLGTAGVKCHLDLPAHPPEWPLSADVRHHLFLTVKEALNNVVRHGAATEVWLRLSLTPEGIVTRVEDNGRGFERAPDDALADGLRNMRQRMQEAGGEFAIESGPNAGTRVCLTLPLP